MTDAPSVEGLRVRVRVRVTDTPSVEGLFYIERGGVERFCQRWNVLICRAGQCIRVGVGVRVRVQCFVVTVRFRVRTRGRRLGFLLGSGEMFSYAVLGSAVIPSNRGPL